MKNFRRGYVGLLSWIERTYTGKTFINGYDPGAMRGQVNRTEATILPAVDLGFSTNGLQRAVEPRGKSLCNCSPHVEFLKPSDDMVLEPRFKGRCTPGVLGRPRLLWDYSVLYSVGFDCILRSILLRVR